MQSELTDDNTWEAQSHRLGPPSPRGHSLPEEPIELTVTTSGLIAPAPASMASTLVELFFRLPSIFPDITDSLDFASSVHGICNMEERAIRLRQRFAESIDLRREATTDLELQYCMRGLAHEIVHMRVASHVPILHDLLPPSKFSIHTQLSYSCTNCGEHACPVTTALAIAFTARRTATVDVASELVKFLAPTTRSCPWCLHPVAVRTQKILKLGDVMTFHVAGRTKVALTLTIHGQEYALCGGLYHLDQGHCGAFWSGGEAMFWYYRDYPEYDAWKSTGKYQFLYATQVMVEELPERVVGSVLFYQRVRNVAPSPLLPIR